jgi:hypothetical protein
MTYKFGMLDDNGQISTDFLLGLSLFLIALMFVIQFIPGMFIPSLAGESSLDYTAYRTASILAEDTGWWGNSTGSATDWENHPNNIMRIGLANDNDINSRLTNTPNMLSKNKINSMMQVNESFLIEKLGLYNNVDGTSFSYGYNISISKNNELLCLNNTSISFGESTPAEREVAKITRIVLVETGNVSYFNGTELTTNYAPPSRTAAINISGPLDENATIQIGTFNISGSSPSFKNASLDGVYLPQIHNYTISKKDTVQYTPFNGSIDANDTLSISLNSSLFNANQTYMLELEFNNITFSNSGPVLEYNSKMEKLYEYAYLTVEVWQ